MNNSVKFKMKSQHLTYFSRIDRNELIVFFQNVNVMSCVEFCFELFTQIVNLLVLWLYFHINYTVHIIHGAHFQLLCIGFIVVFIYFDPMDLDKHILRINNISTFNSSVNIDKIKIYPKIFLIAFFSSLLNSSNLGNFSTFSFHPRLKL